MLFAVAIDEDNGDGCFRIYLRGRVTVQRRHGGVKESLRQMMPSSSEGGQCTESYCTKHLDVLQAVSVLNDARGAAMHKMTADADPHSRENVMNGYGGYDRLRGQKVAGI